MSEERLTILVAFSIGQQVQILGDYPAVIIGYFIDNNLGVTYRTRRMVDGMIYDVDLLESDLAAVEACNNG